MLTVYTHKTLSACAFVQVQNLLADANISNLQDGYHGEFINQRLSFVITAKRKLPINPEGILAVICHTVMIGLLGPIS